MKSTAGMARIPLWRPVLGLVHSGIDAYWAWRCLTSPQHPYRVLGVAIAILAAVLFVGAVIDVRRWRQG